MASTFEPTDQEIIQTILAMNLIPAHFRADELQEHGRAWVSTDNSMSTDEVRRLIADDRLLRAIVKSKAKAFDIARTLAGPSLKRASRVGNLFYEAFRLPRPTIFSKAVELSTSHFVLHAAEIQSPISAIDLTHDPLQIISASGMTEGEAVSEFKERAVRISRLKSVKQREEHRKRTIASNLRKTSDMFDICESKFRTPHALELRLYHQATRHNVDLATSDRAIRFFATALLKDDTIPVATVTWKRQWAASCGYFYRVWIIMPVELALLPIGALGVVDFHWQAQAGSGSCCRMTNDFECQLATAHQDIKKALKVDHFLSLAPDAEISHFGVSWRPSQPVTHAPMMSISYRPSTFNAHVNSQQF